MADFQNVKRDDGTEVSGKADRAVLIHVKDAAQYGPQAIEDKAAKGERTSVAGKVSLQIAQPGSDGKMQHPDDFSKAREEAGRKPETNPWMKPYEKMTDKDGKDITRKDKNGAEVPVVHTTETNIAGKALAAGVKEGTVRWTPDKEGKGGTYETRANLGVKMEPKIDSKGAPVMNKDGSQAQAAHLTIESKSGFKAPLMPPSEDPWKANQAQVNANIDAAKSAKEASKAGKSAEAAPDVSKDVGNKDTVGKSAERSVPTTPAADAGAKGNDGPELG